MTKFLNLSNDSTFANSSPFIAPTQKAVKEALDLKADKETTYTKNEVDVLIATGGGGGGTLDIPTKVSELENDVGYITANEIVIPSEYVTTDELNSATSNYITADDIVAGSNISIERYNNTLTISSTGGSSGGATVDLTNYYTKNESNIRFAQKSTEHTHSNKTTILDLFSLDGGVLKWNGNPIPINPTSVEKTMDGTYDNQEIFNTGTICLENNIKVISQSIVYMTNPMTPTQNLEEGEEDPNTTYLYVYNNDYLLDTIILPPTSTQGYELPIIKTIKIKATGRVSSQLIISGYCY